MHHLVEGVGSSSAGAAVRKRRGGGGHGGGGAFIIVVVLVAAVAALVDGGLEAARGDERLEGWDAGAEDGDVDFNHGPLVDLFVCCS